MKKEQNFIVDGIEFKVNKEGVFVNGKINTDFSPAFMADEFVGVHDNKNKRLYSAQLGLIDNIISDEDSIGL